MKHLLKLALVIVLLIMVLPAGSVILAQTGAIDTVNLNYIEAVLDNEAGQVTVQAYVSVIDDQGRPVTNLRAEDFTMVEDGQPVTIDSVTVADDPVAIIMVLDTSGSMAEIGQNGLPAIETAKQAAVTFIDSLNEGDKAAAYSFNDEVTLEVDLTADHNAVINSINQFFYEDFGGTCLYDAAIEAIQKSSEVLQGRRAVIVLTDGIDEASQQEGDCSLHTLTDVVAEATQRTSKVPIFTIGFGNVDERELLRMARLTGGQGLIGDNASELSGLFDTIARQLKSQYLVSYQTQAASGEHSILVKVEAGGVSETDQRSVFVPAPQVQPTATPDAAPTPTTESLTVAITDATKDKPEPGMLEVVIEIDPIDQVTQSELFIDEESIAVLQESPFDVFTLQMDELPEGKRTMRVEITGVDGATASNERPITITLPPTPLPTVLPTPTTGVPDPVTNPIFIGLVAAACLLVLLIIGIGIYLVMGRNKQATDLPAAASDGAEMPLPPDIFVTHDEIMDSPVFGGADPFATIDEVIVNAEVIVLESETLGSGQSFKIRKLETTIGRDTDSITNDINIPDPAVSRHHATITFDGISFKVFNKSRNGVFINDKLVSESGETLPNEAEFRLGRKTRLQFKVDNNAPVDDQFRTQDEDEDATLYNM